MKFNVGDKIKEKSNPSEDYGIISTKEDFLKYRKFKMSDNDTWYCILHNGIPYQGPADDYELYEAGPITQFNIDLKELLK